MRISTAKIVIATLIGAGVVTAAAVGVSTQKFRVIGKHPEAGYLVGEEGHAVMNVPEKEAASEEEAVRFAEEVARSRQAGQRELVGAVEVEVNGQLDSRRLGYKYTLADGRIKMFSEMRGGEGGAPPTLFGERQAEAYRLFKQAVTSGQEPAVFERVIEGRTLTFKKYTFTLSDGTAVAWSQGQPKDSQ